MKFTFEARAASCPSGKDREMTIHCWSSSSSKPDFVCMNCGVTFPYELMPYVEWGPFGAAYLTADELKTLEPQCEEKKKQTEVLHAFKEMGP